jgi:hypothetical protein
MPGSSSLQASTRRSGALEPAQMMSGAVTPEARAFSNRGYPARESGGRPMSEMIKTKRF